MQQATLRGSGTFWSAVARHRFGFWLSSKAVSSHRTPKCTTTLCRLRREIGGFRCFGFGILHRPFQIDRLSGFVAAFARTRGPCGYQTRVLANAATENSHHGDNPMNVPRPLPYDLFVSYAHEDDRGDHAGKVAALLDAIRARHVEGF